MRKQPTWIRSILGLALIIGAAQAASLDDKGFLPLVEGTDASQFTLVGIGPDTVTIEDGVVTLSGKPNGYFATKKDYKDYVLVFDWKYDRPADLTDDSKFKGNSGLLLHINGEHKIWPKCIEAQLQNSDAGHLFGVQGAAFKNSISPDARKAAQKKAIKPVGQWNAMEVTCDGGKIICKLNDVEIDAGTDASPVGGPIGWQSEGGVISLRNLRIKPID
jgi:3-keto-disaccharide hydrolase